MKRIFLALIIAVSANALDFETKMDVIDCYKKYNNIYELAGETYMGLLALGMANTNWDTNVKVIKLMDNLRSVLIKNCGVRVQRAFIDASDSYNATIDVIGEMAESAMMLIDEQ